jgi:hypothetical protein
LNAPLSLVDPEAKHRAQRRREGTGEPVTRDVVKELQTELAERQGWRMQNLMSQLESPIEQALVLAMMVRGFEHEPVPVGFLGEHVVDPPKVGFYNGIRCGLSWAVPQVYVQVGDEKYRVDLLVSAASTRDDDPMAGPVLVAVECDGHDYHERTKEQAQRDKARDRALQSIGWRVARFTGSEIWKDPVRVVIQLSDFIRSIGGHAQWPLFEYLADFLPVLKAEADRLEKKRKR